MFLDVHTDLGCLNSHVISVTTDTFAQVLLITQKLPHTDLPELREMILDKESQAVDPF